MKEKIRNLGREEVLVPADQIETRTGEIVSRTLAQTSGFSLTLFAFAEGEEIAEHTSTGDALVMLLEGNGLFTIGGREHRVSAGQCLLMPERIPHAVYAPEPFKMFLVVVKEG